MVLWEKHVPKDSKADRDVGTADLHSRYLVALWGGTLCVSLWTSLRAINWRPDLDLLYTWPVPIVLITGTSLTYVLRSRRPRLAAWVLMLSLTFANAFEVSFFPRGLAPYLFALIAIAAALLMTELEALVMDGLALLALLLAVLCSQPRITWQTMQQPIAFVFLAALVSWPGTYQIYTALGWAWHSTQQAMTATQQAQKRRAELLRLNKELDSAYQRLERQNQMLILARQEAEEARRLKTQFANAISHELRSPLNLILGFSEMMVNSPELYGPDPWPSRLREHIEHIYRNSQHLSQLIDDVLDMGRIDAHRLALMRLPESLAEAIAESLAAVRSLYEARGLYLRSEIPKDLPSVSCDRVRIRQVLLNLLTNALRFTSHGGVTVRAVYQGTGITVSISDTGVGIAADDLPGLFQDFRQLDGTFYHWQRGSGLGLAISKRLVEMHGGRIWAESTPGQGSTFSFFLPVQSQPSDVALVSARNEQLWDDLERRARARKPILVYAPTPEIQRLLGTCLAAYDVAWLAEGEDVTQAAARMHPLAVVWATDGSGEKLLLPANLVQKIPGITVIVCSLPSAAGRVSLSGFADYLVKPVSRYKLISALQRLDRNVSSILIVEDEAPMREFLAAALATFPSRCQIWQAESGTQALHLMTSVRPDVILLDIGLPDIDGMELASRINAATSGKVPIVAVTAQDNPAGLAIEASDTIYCTRLGHFSQQEVERLLCATLEAFSPSATLEYTDSAGNAVKSR